MAPSRRRSSWKSQLLYVKPAPVGISPDSQLAAETIITVSSLFTLPKPVLSLGVSWTPWRRRLILNLPTKDTGPRFPTESPKFHGELTGSHWKPVAQPEPGNHCPGSLLHSTPRSQNVKLPWAEWSLLIFPSWPDAPAQTGARFSHSALPCSLLWAPRPRPSPSPSGVHWDKRPENNCPVKPKPEQTSALG